MSPAVDSTVIRVVEETGGGGRTEAEVASLSCVGSWSMPRKLFVALLSAMLEGRQVLKWLRAVACMSSLISWVF
jgi:hypothetical protein